MVSSLKSVNDDPDGVCASVDVTVVGDEIMVVVSGVLVVDE